MKKLLPLLFPSLPVPTRNRRCNDQSGSVLVVVLWLVVILVTAVTSGAYMARTELRRASYAVQSVQALGIALTGLERAKAFLIADDASIDGAADTWRTAPALCQPGPLGNGTLTVQVRDGESMLNLNTASPEMLRVFAPLQALGPIDELIDSLQDWIDTDGTARIQGAEHDYYRLMSSTPYLCKNAPLETMDELYLLKGFRSVVDLSALASFATLHSSSKININTAPVEVLGTIPGIGLAGAGAIVGRRIGTDAKEGTVDDEPFTSVEELLLLIGTERYDLAKGWIAVASQWFVITARAQVGGVRKNIEAVVYRNGTNLAVTKYREW